MQPHRPRDPFEVGLGRYNKKDELPPWVSEKGPWLLVGAIVFIAVFICAGGIFLIQPESAGPTVLSLVYGPAKTYETGSSNKVIGISLKIKNTGTAPAEGIEVYVQVPNRDVDFQLEGPVSLEPQETAEYLIAGELVMPPKPAIKARFTCTNCPK